MSERGMDRLRFAAAVGCVAASIIGMWVAASVDTFSGGVGFMLFGLGAVHGAKAVWLAAPYVFSRPESAAERDKEV